MRQKRNNVNVLLGGLALLAFAVGGLVLFRAFGAGSGSTTTSTNAYAVTLFPQPTLVAANPVPTSAQIPTSGVDTPRLPQPNQPAQQYVVQANDTLWDIAVKFGLSVDQLIGANPAINPDLLGLGQVLNVPASSYVPPALPAAEPKTAQQTQASGTGVQGTVKADSGGLRLRKAPDGEVITKLAPNTPLQIFGEVAGKTWLQVMTPQGTQGYVMAQFVDVGGAVLLATLSPDIVSVATAVPVGPLEYPYLSDLSARVYEIYRNGQAQGNRANGIVLVGDSNTDNPQFLAPLDWSNYSLSSYAYLQPTIDFFRGSFAQNSPAAKGGFNTAKVLEGGDCGDTNLACAYNQQRPSIALILLGTGDQHAWQTFEERYKRIVEYTIQRGIIPVLITKADDLECRDNSAPCGFINGKIAQVAGAYQVPLLNLRQVVQALPGGGCLVDGFHYNAPADNKSAWFTPDYLQYGYTQRNLTALQTLDVIRRKVIQPGT